MAAAGETEGLAPRVAIAWLAAVVAGLIITTVLGARMSLLEKLRPEYSVEILTLKAKEIIKGLGYTDHPIDTAPDFFYDGDFIDYVEKNDKPKPRWNEILAGRPSVFRFWYRLWVTMQSLGSNHLVIQAQAMVVVYGIAALAVVRFGLVTLAVGIFTVDLMLNLPLTLDLSAWYASSSMFVLIGILALATWGFYTSLAGQRLLKEDLFQ